MEVRRRQVWIVSFDEQTVGTEIRGTRPGLIISDDLYNIGESRKVIVLPITSQDTGIPLHVPLPPKEGGLTKPSFIVCDQIQSISRSRLKKACGTVSRQTMEKAEEMLRALIFS